MDLRVDLRGDLDMDLPLDLDVDLPSSCFEVRLNSHRIGSLTENVGAKKRALLLTHLAPKMF